MPTPEQQYLEELASRVRGALGEELVGVYAGGSWALGDYEPGRSDLDVAAVVRGRVARPRAAALAETLRHGAFPCPARGLEFVLYPESAVRAPSVEPGFDLNLNTGVGMAERIDFEPVPGEEHWFAIDRSILSQHGVALFGPEAAGLFAPIPRERLLPVLAEALRRHSGGAARPDDAVLNACRTLRFTHDGVWTSKRAAGDWILRRGQAPELVAAALRARDDESARLERSDVEDFVRAALAEIESL
jgi:hypothetical protein